MGGGKKEVNRIKIGLDQEIQTASSNQTWFKCHVSTI